MEDWKDNIDDADAIDGLDPDNDRYGGKDAIIFLIDASSENMHKLGSFEDTPFRMALKCMHATLKQKILGSPRDVLGILLFGTENKVGVRDFDNQALLLPVDVPKAKAILRLETLLECPDVLASEIGHLTGGSPFAVHEALWQCQALFNEVQGKTAAKKVVLFTTNADPHDTNGTLKKQAIKKASDLQDAGIWLDVVPMGDGDTFDWTQFYGDMISKEDLCPEEGPAKKLSDLMRTVRKRIHKKRALGRCYFDLGAGVRLSVASYNFVQRASKPPKVKLCRDTNEDVKTQRQFIDHMTGAPLLPSDINKFQEYGGRKIELTQDEVGVTQKSLLDGSVGLGLVAFKPRSELRLVDFVRSCHFLYPDESLVKGSHQLFTSLLLKCLDRDVVAICTYKPRDTSLPSYVALYPQNEEKDADGAQTVPPGFLIVYLPFADDFRNVPDNVRFTMDPSTTLVDHARTVVKRLRMKHYNPEAFENPSLQSHYRLIEALALQKDDLEEEDEDTTLPPMDVMAKRLGNTSQTFLSALNLEIGDDVVVGRAKKGGGATMNGEVDMEKHIRDKNVHVLKVNDLKQFLKSVGVVVTGKKKDELVQDVYNHQVS